MKILQRNVTTEFSGHVEELELYVEAWNGRFMLRFDQHEVMIPARSFEPWRVYVGMRTVGDYDCTVQSPMHGMDGFLTLYSNEFRFAEDLTREVQTWLGFFFHENVPALERSIKAAAPDAWTALLVQRFRKKRKHGQLST